MSDKNIKEELREVIKEVITDYCDGTYYGLTSKSNIDENLNPIELVNDLTEKIYNKIISKK